MQDTRFLVDYIKKSKAMPQRMIILVTQIKALLAPIISIGSFWTLIEFTDITSKPLWAILAVAVTALFTYLGVRINARTKVEVKTIDATESADVNKFKVTFEIFDRAMLESKGAREHFTEELKKQRDDFKEDLIEARNHYEQREQQQREDFHGRLKESAKLAEKYITRCTKIEAQLKSMGIHVSEECEITLPSSFERRNK